MGGWGEAQSHVFVSSKEMLDDLPFKILLIQFSKKLDDMSKKNIFFTLKRNKVLLYTASRSK